MREHRKVNGSFEEAIKELPFDKQQIVRNAVVEARNKLAEECYGTAFGGGYRGALLQANKYENMDDDEILLEAQKRNLSLHQIQWKSNSGSDVSFDIV